MSPHDRRKEFPSEFPYVRILILSIGDPLSPSWNTHLPKSSPANTFPLRARISTYKFGGRHKDSDQGKAPSQSIHHTQKEGHIYQRWTKKLSQVNSQERKTQTHHQRQGPQKGERAGGQSQAIGEGLTGALRSREILSNISCLQSACWKSLASSSLPRNKFSQWT